MEITRQADYAVRAVCALALRSDEERISSDELATRQSIPQAFLIKILARLAAEGVVDTRRGVNGGVRLARPAGEITLLQVVEAIDGPLTLNRCARRPGECPSDGSCLVHPIWVGLRDQIREQLSKVTFAAIVRGDYFQACHSLSAPAKECPTGCA